MNTSVVLITLIFYKILLIGIGFWASKRMKSQEDMLLGGRSLGPLVGAISYSASAASAWTLLGMSGLAYTIGLPAIWIAAGAVLGSALAWIWVAPRMRRFSKEHKILTLTDFLSFGADGPLKKAIVLLSSLIILVSFIFYIASQFQGAGNTFALTFDMQASESILLGGVVILLYTMLGGFWAVSLTDTLQGILMFLAAIIMPVAAFITLSDMGGFWVSLEKIYEPSALTLSGQSMGLALVGLIIGNLAVGLGALGQPHLQARFMAMKDDKAINQAAILGIGWYAFVFFGMCLLGLMGHAILPDLNNPENIFFELTAVLFPSVLGGIILAAVLSAVMSTADSMLLVAAGIFSHDLGLSQRFKDREVLVSRLAIVAVTALSIWVAIQFEASIFNRVLFAWNALGAAFGPLIIMRLAGVDFRARGAFLAIASGFGCAVYLFSQPNMPGDWLERLAPFILGLVILYGFRRRS
ncbi:sodium/proline symporter [Temperatibacter marinus]|uniref:Sodium/proline symporter n=1 Tax=Temperatibacter marinus TaxID=1456591 RepID=A0AA52EIN2_9PROT|nr:sodium/proline symporter [Temperatibacter marinus]WND03505.1 sodium/proline symporter [Temperatibacter marinus]